MRTYSLFIHTYLAPVRIEALNMGAWAPTNHSVVGEVLQDIPLTLCAESAEPRENFVSNGDMGMQCAICSVSYHRDIETKGIFIFKIREWIL